MEGGGFQLFVMFVEINIMHTLSMQELGFIKVRWEFAGEPRRHFLKRCHIEKYDLVTIYHVSLGSLQSQKMYSGDLVRPLQCMQITSVLSCFLDIV